MPEGGISKDLLEALRSGDHDAFSRIYLHYWDTLYKFLMRLIGSDEDAREMTQDIFIALWESRQKVDPSRGVKSYLYGIARHKAMDFFDHRKVEERYSRISAGGNTEDSAPDDIAVAREMELLTKLAVGRMPRTRREVFEMVVEKGLSIDEVATRLGITKAGVSTHLYHARKELKELLTSFILILLLSQM